MLNFEVFGKNLQTERKKQVPRMTQDNLAEKTSLTVQTISDYERGKKFPTLENAVAIANALGLSLDYLCDGSDIAEQEETRLQIGTLADVQSIFDLLCEKIPSCAIESENDDVFFRIENCPQIAKYYKNYLTMKGLLDARTITPEIFQIWKDGASKSLKGTSIEAYDFPL